MTQEKVNKLLGFDLKKSLPDSLKDIAMLDDIIHKIMEDNDLPNLKDQTGLDAQKLEMLYSLAYNFYNQGLYKKSLDMFKILILFEPQNYKYNYGSAACLQMLGEYVRAIQVYFSCALIDVENPYPYFYALDCSLKLKDLENTLFCAEKCLERTEKKKEHQELHQKVLLILESLQKHNEKPSSKKKKQKNLKKKTKAKAKKKAAAPKKS